MNIPDQYRQAKSLTLFAARTAQATLPGAVETRGDQVTFSRDVTVDGPAGTSTIIRQGTHVSLQSPARGETERIALEQPQPPHGLTLILSAGQFEFTRSTGSVTVASDGVTETKSLSRIREALMDRGAAHDSTSSFTALPASFPNITCTVR